ncbi:MAG TPA: OmpA family protein [Blastocatellia bacterium]|nr:OmpA family protein [Blastocatellia bacterium]
MYSIRIKQVTIGLTLGLTLATAVFAQSSIQQQSQQTGAVPSGLKQKVSGVIVDRNAESLVVRNEVGSEINVLLTDNTRVRQQKKKIIGGDAPQLMSGLFIDVVGRTNNSGYLVAERIRFSKTALMVASAIGARVDRVERRVSANEANDEEQAVLIEQSDATAKAALQGSQTAQRIGAVAILGIGALASEVEEVISGLDQYEVTKRTAVTFAASSAVLSPEAKAALNEIAQEASDKDGYVIEVEGHASSDGDVDQNRRLSQRRAEAVVTYLVETNLIPPRRIVVPVGAGSANPIADENSREGREQNRRVEVKLLVNRTLGSPDLNDRQ